MSTITYAQTHAALAALGIDTDPAHLVSVNITGSKVEITRVVLRDGKPYADKAARGIAVAVEEVAVE